MAYKERDPRREQEMPFLPKQTQGSGTDCVNAKEVSETGLRDSTTSTPSTRRYGCNLQGVGSACGANGIASVDHPVGSVLSDNWKS